MKPIETRIYDFFCMYFHMNKCEIEYLPFFWSKISFDGSIFFYVHLYLYIINNNYIQIKYKKHLHRKLTIYLKRIVYSTFVHTVSSMNVNRNV